MPGRRGSGWKCGWNIEARGGGLEHRAGSAGVEYMAPRPEMGTSRSATGLRPPGRGTYPVATPGRTRSNRIRAIKVRCGWLPALR